MLLLRGLWSVVFSALTLCSVTAVADAAHPPVADKVMAFVGEKGVNVWALRIGDRVDSQALVQIEGIDHEWNGLIQKMKVESTSRDIRYSTEIDGKKFVVLILQNTWGELYFPGENRAMSIVYSDDLSSQGNPQVFLTDYLGQK